MDTIQTQINTYHILFYVCLTMMVVFVAVSILVFFLFHIKNNILYMLGFSEKVAVKKTSAESAKTGGLKSGQINMDYTTSNLQKYAPASETTTLNAGSEETSRLAPSKLPQEQLLQTRDVSPRAVQPTMAPVTPVLPTGFHFVITENVMVIHTNELI